MQDGHTKNPKPILKIKKVEKLESINKDIPLSNFNKEPTTIPPPDDEWIEQAWFSTAVIQDEKQKQEVIDKLKGIAKKYPNNFYLLPDGTYGMVGTINGKKTSEYIKEQTGLPMYINLVNKKDPSQVIPNYTFEQEITITPDQEYIPYDPKQDIDTQKRIQEAIEEARKEQITLDYQKSLQKVNNEGISNTKLTAYNILSSIVGGVTGLTLGEEKETGVYLGLAKTLGIPYNYAVSLKNYNNNKTFKDKLTEWVAPVGEAYHLTLRGLMGGDPWAGEKDTEEQSLLYLAHGIASLSMSPQMIQLGAVSFVPAVGEEIKQITFTPPELVGAVIRDITPNVSDNEKTNELFKDLTSTLGMVLVLHYYGKGTAKLKELISNKLKNKLESGLSLTEEDIKTELETNPVFRGYFEEALKNPEETIRKNKEILKENGVEFYVTKDGIAVPKSIMQENVARENRAIDKFQEHKTLQEQKILLQREKERLTKNLEDSSLTIDQRESVINEIDRVSKLEKKVDNLIKENIAEQERIRAEQDVFNIQKEKERNLPVIKPEEPKTDITEKLPIPKLPEKETTEKPSETKLLPEADILSEKIEREKLEPITEIGNVNFITTKEGGTIKAEDYRKEVKKVEKYNKIQKEIDKIEKEIKLEKRTINNIPPTPENSELISNRVLKLKELQIKRGNLIKQKEQLEKTLKINPYEYLKEKERRKLGNVKEDSQRVSSIEQNREETIKTEPVVERSEETASTSRVFQEEKEIKKELEESPLSSLVEEKRIISEQSYKEAKDRLSKPNENLNVLPIYEYAKNFKDWVTVGLYHMENGARTLFEFGRKMVKEFGEVVRPYLRQIYNVAKKVWDSIPYFDPETLGALGGDIKSKKDLLKKVEETIKDIEIKTEKAKELGEVVERFENRVKPASELSTKEKLDMLEREHRKLQEPDTKRIQRLMESKGDIAYKDQQNYNVFSVDKVINEEIKRYMQDPENKKKVEEFVRGGRSWKLTEEIANGLIKTGIITEKQLEKFVKGGTANAETILAFGKIVLNKYEELAEMRKNITEASLSEKEIFVKKALELQTIAEHLALKEKGIRSEIGRALNILKKLREVPPEVKEELARKYSKEVAEGIEGYIKRAEKITNPTWKDWFFFIYYNTILSDPQTQLANLYGNSFMLGVHLLRRAIFFPDRKTLPSRVWKGVKEGAKEFIKTYKGADNKFLSTKFTERTKEGTEVIVPDTLPKKILYALLPTTTLQAVDKFMIKIYHELEKSYVAKEISKLHELPFKKVTEILDAYLSDPNIIMADEIEEIFRPYVNYILRVGERGTFHQKGGKVLESTKTMLKESVVGLTMCPFPTITVNFIKTAIAETPLALRELKNAKLPIEKKDIYTRSIFGSVALSGLIYATMTGAITITGRLSDDQEEIKFFKSIGLQPYHIYFNLFGKRLKLNYMNLSPYHMIFGQVGAFWDDVRRGKTDLNSLPSVMASIIKNSYKVIIDQNFMQTLNQIEKSLLQENEEKFWNQLGKIGISISGITTPLGIPYRLSRTITGNYPEYETQTPAEYFFWRVGLTEYLRPKINQFGEQVTGAETRLPIPTNAFKDVNKAGEWLLQNNIKIETPRKFKINGAEIDDDTYYKYKIMAGKLTEQYILNAMNNTKGLTQEELNKVIKNDIEAIRNACRLSFEKNVNINTVVNPKLLAQDIQRKKVEMQENKIEEEYQKTKDLKKKEELLIKGRKILEEIENIKEQDNYKKLKRIQDNVTANEGRAIYIPDREDTRTQRIFEKGAIGTMVFDVNQVLKKHDIDYSYRPDKREKASNYIDFNRINRLLYKRYINGKLDSPREEIIKALREIKDMLENKDYTKEINMIREVDKETRDKKREK